MQTILQRVWFWISKSAQSQNCKQRKTQRVRFWNMNNKICQILKRILHLRNSVLSSVFTGETKKNPVFCVFSKISFPIKMITQNSQIMNGKSFQNFCFCNRFFLKNQFLKQKHVEASYFERKFSRCIRFWVRIVSSYQTLNKTLQSKFTFRLVFLPKKVIFCTLLLFIKKPNPSRSFFGNVSLFEQDVCR